MRFEFPVDRLPRSQQDNDESNQTPIVRLIPIRPASDAVCLPLLDRLARLEMPVL